MNNLFESVLNFWLSPAAVSGSSGEEGTLARRSFSVGGVCFKGKGWKKNKPTFNESLQKKS
jgi:hypothetical protein